MQARRSAALRFLYALPLIWLAMRLPVAIDSMETLLGRRPDAAIVRAAVAIRYAETTSVAAVLPIEPPAHKPLSARVKGGIRPSPVESPLDEVMTGQPSPPMERLAPSPTPNPDPAWQLASAAYIQLGHGRRREAAAMLRKADALSPNARWRRDLASLTSHWHGDAWIFGRDGGSTPLGVNAPALGRSQLGMRIDYLPDPLARRTLIVETRVARPFRHGATQLAIGVGIRPLPLLPLRVTAERQIATGRSTRDAWSLRAEGGLDAVPLPAGFRLSTYGEAGVVGARSADVFADGDVRITRPIMPAVHIGGGIWAASQPGAQRLDIGPAIVGRLQQGRIGLSASIDYRLRIAGNARPGSGPAVTVAAGF